MSLETMWRAGIDPRSIGIWTWTFDRAPAETTWRQVRAIEELGYGTLWVPEVAGKEGLAHAAVLLAQTSRIVVANGVARVHERSPRAMAAGQQTLSDAYPGRYLLGLGVGAGGKQPIETLRRYLDEHVGRARAPAREHLAGYVHSPYNRAKFRRLGYSEEELAEGGGDRFVDDLVAWGSLARIVERVRAHFDAGADHVALQALTGEGSASLEEQWESLARALVAESGAPVGRSN